MGPPFPPLSLKFETIRLRCDCSTYMYAEEQVYKNKTKVKIKFHAFFLLHGTHYLHSQPNILGIRVPVFIWDDIAILYQHITASNLLFCLIYG